MDLERYWITGWKMEVNAQWPSYFVPCLQQKKYAQVEKEGLAIVVDSIITCMTENLQFSQITNC